ncbi:carbon-nitrogen hydrolase family protein [Aneurinibacillus terranovensis]|uniref:carbon-nitrogen hydrolase family protein n=1 Tax=Aneurinibacillus terranovensis TaxID=278991 RepID=UPI000423F1AC|nr:carbon-nitrogen hydrolase family protein [Aneurinibacillus terranovensis]
MKINAAAVQLSSIVGDKQANRRRITDWIETIVIKHPDCNLVVFPELSVTGYDCGLHMHPLAEPVEGETFHILAAEAKKHGIYLVYGGLERNPSGDKPYNTVWMIGPDGSLVHTYRKVHLTEFETPCYQPGDRFSVVKTDLGTVGVLICWDMAFPEAARTCALQGVDLLICPAAWEKPYERPYLQFSMARALDNTVPLITCNHTGKNENVEFFGHSRIYDATGSELEAIGEDEGYIYAEIDPNLTKQHRQFFYTMLNERRPDLYVSSTGHINTPV